jgi:hypothetical protein
MINSFSPKIDKNIVSPGIVLYNNVINFNENDIDCILSLKKYIEGNNYIDTSNSFFSYMKKINKIDFAKNIQKTILHCFADYCDLYPEAIHSVQWQEPIDITVEYSGKSSDIFNPNKSHIDDNKKIVNTPFSRKIVVELAVDDQYDGGTIQWQYLDNIKINKQSKGSILFYPANYLFSKTTGPIIKGRKISLVTFFNGGKDFLSEENNIEEENEIFRSSYMR